VTTPAEDQIGWRQGSVLPDALARTLVEEGGFGGLDSFDLVVVASHDCDVANRDLDKEPTAELLVARLVGQRPDGNLTFGKNPRSLHLQVRGPDGLQWYGLSMGERFSVSRARLLDAEPNDEHDLSAPGVRQLGLWLAYRYRRAAFPDEFNRRAEAANSQVKAVLKANGQYVSGVLIAVADEELPRDENYSILIWMTTAVNDYSDRTRRALSEVATDKIASALSACSGIVVTESELRSEADVTLDDLKLLKRWDDYDTLSLRDPDSGNLSADV